MLVITLPKPPTTNNLYINRGRGRVKSPGYMAWIKEAGYLLNLQKPKPIFGKISILLEVEEGTAIEDVCNREKAAIDLLVSHKVIQGDDRRFVRKVTLQWADVEGIRIAIEPIVPDVSQSATEILARVRNQIRPMNIPKLNIESKK